MDHRERVWARVSAVVLSEAVLPTRQFRLRRRCSYCVHPSRAQACTLFNSEMAPPHMRGALNILFQLSVTIGILAAQLINYGTQHFYWGWRVSLGCAIVPAIILFIGSLTLPGALADACWLPELSDVSDI